MGFSGGLVGRGLGGLVVVGFSEVHKCNKLRAMRANSTAYQYRIPLFCLCVSCCSVVMVFFGSTNTFCDGCHEPNKIGNVSGDYKSPVY